MIAMLDSSFDRPTPTQAAQMHADGVRVYGVYITTRAGVGLAAPWSRADVEVLKQAGLGVIAFASGNDDPVALKAMASDWGVLGCLDNESRIREPGPWAQSWLNASGFGLYGLLSTHATLSAPFRIVAMYPGYDPMATWPTSPPAVPHGWQWRGTHDEYGVSVDRSWLDDWFVSATGASDPMALTDDDKNWLLTAIQEPIRGDVNTVYGAVNSQHLTIENAIGDVQSKIAALAGSSGTALSTDQAAQLQNIADAVTRIEQALRGA